MQNDQEQLRQEAYEHLRAKRWDKASTAFGALVRQNGEDEDALIGLALAQDRLGEYDSMLDTVAQALDLNPNSALALACKARALQKLERLSEATIANDQALLLDTNLALAWFNRSGQQLLQGHYPEALRYALRAIELDSTDPRAWANKGFALLDLNRLFEALKAMDESLNRDPNYLIALQIKGEILRRFGRLKDVVVTMRHALDIAPDDVSALNLMAHALRTLGEYESLLPIEFAESDAETRLLAVFLPPCFLSENLGPSQNASTARVFARLFLFPHLQPKCKIAPNHEYTRPRRNKVG